MATNKLGVTATAVAAALAVAYAGSAWYFGKEIETAHRQIDTRLAKVPYIKLLRHDYERGVFNATETITVELTSTLLAPAMSPKVAEVADVADVANVAVLQDDAEAEIEGSNAAPEADPEVITEIASSPAQVAAPPPLTLSFVSTIEHGPFPGFATLGAGRAQTKIVFDESIQAKLDAAFGGQPPVAIKTLYGFSGGGQIQLNSPAFKTEVVLDANAGKGDKANISGEGFDLSLNFTRDFEQYEVEGNAPRFEMQSMADGKDVKLIAAGLQLKAQAQRVFADEPMFYAGSQEMSLAELRIETTEPTAPKIAIKDVKYALDIPVTGEMIDIVAKIGAAEVHIADRNYGPAHYDFSFRQLGARKIAALDRQMMALYAKQPAMQDASQAMQFFAPLRQPLLDLLADNPRFAIDRLSFRTPDGDAALSASLGLKDASAVDFANPMALMQKIDFAADLAFPPSLLDLMQATTTDVEEAAARKMATDQTLAIFVQQGYASLEAGIVKTTIVFNGKDLLINGQPFNPFSLMPARQ